MFVVTEQKSPTRPVRGGTKSGCLAARRAGACTRRFCGAAPM